MAEIDITGLDPATVLLALYAAAVPNALHGGYMNAPPLDREDAEAMLEENQSFAYVNGRALFLTIKDNVLHAHDYNERNRAKGPELAQRIIARLRGEGVSDKEFASQVMSLGVPGVPR